MSTQNQVSTDMLSTRQVAVLLGVSTKTIYRMEEKGLIQSIRTPGGQRRFTRDSIQEYLDKSRGFSAPQNPSKYKNRLVLKENDRAYTLFEEIAVQQKVPPQQQFNRLEQIISLNASRNHQQHYDKEVTPQRWLEEWVGPGRAVKEWALALER